MHNNHRTEAKDLPQSTASSEDVTDNVLCGMGRSAMRKGYGSPDGLKGPENEPQDANEEVLEGGTGGFLGRSNGWER